MKPKNERKHHTYDLTYGTVDVTIEVENNSSYVDKTLRLQLKPDKTNPVFECFIGNETIQIPVSKESIGHFELPTSVSPLSKDRIEDGINAFLDAIYA